MNRIERYFLSDLPEEVTTADRIWFYGLYVIAFLIALGTIQGVQA